MDTTLWKLTLSVNSKIKVDKDVTLCYNIVLGEGLTHTTTGDSKMTDMMFAKGFAVVSIPHRNIIRDDIKTRKEAEQYMRALVECSAYKNNTVRVIDNT